MTTTVLEDEEIGTALAMLWQRHRKSNFDRIALLELTATNVLRATSNEDAIAEGARAAHKLADPWVPSGSTPAAGPLSKRNHSFENR